MIYILGWPDHMKDNNTTKELHDGEFIFSININGKIFAMAGSMNLSVGDVEHTMQTLNKMLHNTIRQKINGTPTGQF